LPELGTGTLGKGLSRNSKTDRKKERSRKQRGGEKRLWKQEGGGSLLKKKNESDLGEEKDSK